jgi:hypothetical protein
MERLPQLPRREAETSREPGIAAVCDVNGRGECETAALLRASPPNKHPEVSSFLRFLCLTDV